MGLGVIFELFADETMLAWAVNTGWFHRPVETDYLVQGPQQRASKPGIDRMFRYNIASFPKPLYVSVLTPTRQWDIERDDIRDELMDALTQDGEGAVFEILKRVHREHVA